MIIRGNSILIRDNAYLEDYFSMEKMALNEPDRAEEHRIPRQDKRMDKQILRPSQVRTGCGPKMGQQGLG